ncbi:MULTISPECIES: ribokinase [unclassified Sporolactobacillus]|uniref:ribokinase n=1 Tax=unclassified Sporolactobacillus TaxID=2628533 RepID=UPI002368E34B|nr:ribokinase [Sporolactobacillus sp. CQH2019]MDD9150477.1 ribokinase [Sporolactobacillus sp. CQH2019]
MSSKNIVVIGSLNYDIILKQQRMPHKGETYVGDEMVQGPGGKGSNQAAQCAKLGLPTTMVGKVGDDRFGEALVGALKAVGVNVSMIRKQGSTGMGLVHVMPDGDYYSTIIKGANTLITKNDIDEIKDLMDQAGFIILQQEIPQEIIDYIITTCENSASKIVLNNAPAKKIKADVLKKADVLVVNETEAAFMIGREIQTVDDGAEAGKEILPLTGGMVVVTLGSAGAIVVTEKQALYQPAYKVRAVDTTGAGDSYIGAFVYGLANQFSVKESMAFASKVSAITVTKNGGQDSFPTKREVEAFSNFTSGQVAK